MQRFAFWKISCCVAVITLGALAFKDSAAPVAPAIAPATGPSTEPFVPHIAVVPPGLHLITVGENTLYCRPEDDVWIKAAAAAAKPVSRPSTTPSDLYDSFQQKRDELVKTIVSDMALSDDKGINEAIDQKLVPALKGFRDLKPAIIFMPITQKQLTELVRGGWSDPRYHYNHMEAEAIFDPDLSLSLNYKLDDMVFWIKIDPDVDAATRAGKITDDIDQFNDFFSPTVARLAEDLGVREPLMEVLLEQVIDPLKLPDKLDWFGKGVAAIYAVKYASMISGFSRTAWTNGVSMDEPGAPLRSQPLDLVNVKLKEDMRPEFWVLYQHTLYRKGASVVKAWIASGGDGVVAKTLPALRANPPVDAPALAKMVLGATGFDISLLLPPNYKVTIAPR